MHFPFNIKLGAAVIPVHFVCETLAYAVGYRYYLYLRKHTKDKINDTNRILIFIGAAIGGFLGSHLLGILEKPMLLSQMSSMYFMGNTTIVGGLLGGLTGVEITKKIIHVKTSSGDLMVYPIILAMIIGRTGCFLAGLEDGTYGIASCLPWAIDFGDGTRRHPTNLYELVFWIVLWSALIVIERKHRYTDGARFKLMMVCYLLFRFAVEFIKPDPFIFAGLSVIQLACLAGIAYYYKVFVNPRKLVTTYA